MPAMPPAIVLFYEHITFTLVTSAPLIVPVHLVDMQPVTLVSKTHVWGAGCGRSNVTVYNVPLGRAVEKVYMMPEEADVAVNDCWATVPLFVERLKLTVLP
jgi:hypothetical protein